MIVIRNWLQEFIDISHLSTDTICDALNSIGLEVDSVNSIKIPNNVVVGYIESCEKLYEEVMELHTANAIEQYCKNFFKSKVPDLKFLS